MTCLTYQVLDVMVVVISVGCGTFFFNFYDSAVSNVLLPGIHVERALAFFLSDICCYLFDGRRCR